MYLQVTGRDECVHAVAMLKVKRLLTGRRLMILLLDTPSPGRLFMTSHSSFKSKPKATDAKKTLKTHKLMHTYVCLLRVGALTDLKALRVEMIILAILSI